MNAFEKLTPVEVTFVKRNCNLAVVVVVMLLNIGFQLNNTALLVSDNINELIALLNEYAVRFFYILLFYQKQHVVVVFY